MEVCLANRIIERWNQKQKKVGMIGIRLYKCDITMIVIETLTVEHSTVKSSGAILCPTKVGIA